MPLTALPGGLRTIYRTGLFYAHEAPNSFATLTQNRVSYIPLWVSSIQAFDQIVLGQVNTLGASSAVRLGIYADSGSYAPSGSPIVDAGTVDTTSTGTGKAATISTILSPGLYWLAAVAQGGTPSCSVFAGSAFVLGLGVGFDAAPFNGQTFAGWIETGISGALVAPGGTLARSSTNLVGVSLRAA